MVWPTWPAAREEIKSASYPQLCHAYGFLGFVGVIGFTVFIGFRGLGGDIT